MEHDILSKYDIGSIFPLYKEDMMIPTMYNDINVGKSRIVFSLCREAMFAIALKYKESKKSVLIPAYTCQTVIDPFIELGWTVHFYNIEKTLRIDLEDLNDKYESIFISGNENLKSKNLSKYRSASKSEPYIFFIVFPNSCKFVENTNVIWNL